MEHLTVFETDKGHFAVRPMEWAGIWNVDGKIQECGLRHTAIFANKEDAVWYANTKNVEEQGLLLKIPCKVGDMVWCIYAHYTKCSENEQEFDDYSCQGCECLECDSYKEHYVQSQKAYSLDWIVSNLNRFGKTVFLTQEQAEEALKKMRETEE